MTEQGDDDTSGEWAMTEQATKTKQENYDRTEGRLHRRGMMTEHGHGDEAETMAEKGQ